jgi:hypothetical protein
MNLHFVTPARRLLAALLMPLLLSACAATTPAEPETVDQRAQARWDALLARDFETAWSYLTPGLRSSITSRDFEIGFTMRKVGYEGAEYLDHSCEGDVCTVRMSLRYILHAPLRGVQQWKSRAVVDETWLRIDGEWWFKPDD